MTRFDEFTERVAARVSIEQWRAVQAMAAERQLSVSDLLRELIDQAAGKRP